MAGLSLDRVTRLCNRVLADQLFQSLKVTGGSSGAWKKEGEAGRVVLLSPNQMTGSWSP